MKCRCAPGPGRCGACDEQPVDSISLLNDPRLPQRFWKHVTVDAAGCWIWGGEVSDGGYGRFFLNKRTRMAHRALFETLVGSVPDGLQLDHLCRVRNCVNPKHLEPVTPRENTMRGSTPAAFNASKTHCKYGHEFTPENTAAGSSPNARDCLQCRRRRAQERTPERAKEIRDAFKRKWGSMNARYVHVACWCGWKNRRKPGECACYDEYGMDCRCIWGSCPKCGGRLYRATELTAQRRLAREATGQ